ncbi:MAG: inositol monophosphatase [Thermoactinospora sp.]|nr:inositol monophosphatase [Thermoactinospora sp.]
MSEELMRVAVEAARAVGEPLRAAFRSRPATTAKRDFQDPVTEHDRACEEIIRGVIAARAPGGVVVGEEGGTTGTRGGDGGRVTWFVDPIDGTANFAAGLPFFCVSIAAAVGGELVAGVVYDPVREQLFSASDEGAWCDGVPLRSTGASADREAMLLTSFPAPRTLAADGQRALDGFARLLASFAALRRPGSAALKLAHVAAGWADVAYGRQASSWDVAAGALLVRRAGGVFLGDPLSGGDYLAHVAGFDLPGSALAGVAGDLLGVGR